jgi:hypothetical protein
MRAEFRQFVTRRAAPSPSLKEEVAVTEAGTSRLRPPGLAGVERMVG